MKTMILNEAVRQASDPHEARGHPNQEHTGGDSGKEAGRIVSGLLRGKARSRVLKRHLACRSRNWNIRKNSKGPEMVFHLLNKHRM